MQRYALPLLLLGVVSFPAPVAGQEMLSLADAIARARANNLDARTAEQAEREATARVAQARGAFLPRVDLTESWQRGDQPVFVFSSLLAQRRFAAGNFAIDSLNHPAATDNFRTALMVEQPLFSPLTAANLRTARLGREIAATRRTAVGQGLALAVTDAYGRVLAAKAARDTAAAALAAATADREAAVHRRDAGRATDADVLQVDVHVARALEQQIGAEADERIARATLNDLMGEDLDARFELAAVPEVRGSTPGDPAALEAEALANRPELQVAALEEQMASATHDVARAAFLPSVSAQAGWELNGGQWNTRAAGWVVGAVARVTLFQGLSDRARLTEAAELGTRRALERQKAENAIRLDVRVALARLEEARAREVASRAGSAQARESHRIVRDRYESGLADVAALLRAAEAVQDADARETAARINLLMAGAVLDRALGK